MSDGQIIIRARVRLVLDIDVSEVWGGDCTMRQVQQQSTERALSAIRGALQWLPVALVEEPIVTTVTTMGARIK
jgi:hypothetical protein